MQQREPKRRQHHSRSRAGCLACKKRHARCDELRLSCTKCRISNTACEYPIPTVSRDEEKWCHMETPGLTVWRISSNSIDPFEALPIKMPFRSQELLKYFFGAETLLNSSIPSAMRNLPLLAETTQTRAKPKEDCIVLVMTEPTYFRSVLLLAGLHYMWKVGSLQNFEQPFLFHKQQLIQLVNSWLAENMSSVTIKQLKLIAILSIAESCVGNYPAAEAHLSGLLTLIEMRQNKPCFISTRPALSDPEEALERLILVAHHFASAVKSRLTHTLAADSNYASIWQNSFTGIPENLVALRLIPYYFQEERSFSTQPIIANRVINALRGLTEAVRKRRFSDGTPHVVHDSSYASETTICDSQNPATCTGCKSLSCLLFSFTEAHVSSTLPDASEASEGTFLSPWRALAASAALYLNNVLLLWSSGQPIDNRLFLRIVGTLVQQLPEVKEGWMTSELTFWMLYTAYFALATNPRAGFDPKVEEIRRLICERLQAWLRINGILEWTDARASLCKVAWPQSTSNLQEDLARQLWDAISAGF